VIIIIFLCWFMNFRCDLLIKMLLDDYKKAGTISADSNVSKIFHAFDVDGDGFLDEKEFHELFVQVCSSTSDDLVSSETESKIFDLLDIDRDSKISYNEFKVSGKYWLRQIFDPVSALIIVDVQEDFLNGTLALSRCPAGQDGNDVVPVINRLLEEVKFDVVAYTFDWHPEDHISFINNVKKYAVDSSSPVTAENAKVMDKAIFAGPPKQEQVLWPPHCVQNCDGAKLHKDLTVVDNPVNIYKGTNSNVDSYSAFFDNSKLSQTKLASILAKHNVTDVYVCGVAYDFCVGFTTLDAIDLGFRTVLINDATRGVDVGDIESMKSRIRSAGGIIENSDMIKNLVEVKDRRKEHGLTAAKNTAEGIKHAQKSGVSLAR